MTPARNKRWPWIVTGLALIGLGVASSLFAGTYVEEAAKRELVDRAKTIAISLDADDVSALTGTGADLTNANYLSLKAQMVRLRSLNPDIRFVYLMGYRSGGLFVFVDSEPTDSKDYSPPGDPYADASERKVSEYLAGSDFSEGPYADRWGTWVSGYAAVRDVENPDGAPVAMVGVDISAATLSERVALAEAAPLILVALVITIVALVYAGRRRREEFLVRLQEQKDKLQVILEYLPVGGGGF